MIFHLEVDNRTTSALSFDGTTGRIDRIADPFGSGSSGVGAYDPIRDSVWGVIPGLGEVIESHPRVRHRAERSRAAAVGVRKKPIREILQAISIAVIPTESILN